MLPLIASLAGQGLGLIGNLITGKGIEFATNFIKEKVGIDIGSITEKPLSNEDAVALRKFQAENELELQKLALEETKTYIADRQDARKMQVEALKQEDTFSKRFIYYYAAFITVATFLYVAAISFLAIPEENVHFVNTVLGFLLGVTLSAVIQFFFGSSKGSNDKQDKLHDITEMVLRERK